VAQYHWGWGQILKITKWDLKVEGMAEARRSLSLLLRTPNQNDKEEVLIDRALGGQVHHQIEVYQKCAPVIRKQTCHSKEDCGNTV
jgi:hypothetical protein